MFLYTRVFQEDGVMWRPRRAGSFTGTTRAVIYGTLRSMTTTASRRTTTILIRVRR